jgi:hypothetical protein
MACIYASGRIRLVPSPKNDNVRAARTCWRSSVIIFRRIKRFHSEWNKPSELQAERPLFDLRYKRWYIFFRKPIQKKLNQVSRSRLMERRFIDSWTEVASWPGHSCSCRAFPTKQWFAERFGWTINYSGGPPRTIINSGYGVGRGGVTVFRRLLWEIHHILAPHSVYLRQYFP